MDTNTGRIERCWISSHFNVIVLDHNLCVFVCVMCREFLVISSMDSGMLQI